MDTHSVVSKWFAFALLGAGAAACDPSVTIADETSDAGNGGADAGSDSGGASSGSGGTSSGAASGGTPAAGGNLGTGGVGTGGDGASGTSGGVSGTGGTPGPTRLGLRLLIENPDPAETGGTCPAASGIEWDIGAPILAGDGVVEVASPTSTDRGTPLADGEEDAEILCVVTGDGVIHAEGGGRDPLLEPPNGRVNFAFNGTATPAERRNVSFSLYTPVTLFVATEQNGFLCTLSELYEILPDTFWGRIDCPVLGNVGRPDVACKATATIVLQNCATE